MRLTPPRMIQHSSNNIVLPFLSKQTSSRTKETVGLMLCKNTKEDFCIKNSLISAGSFSGDSRRFMQMSDLNSHYIQFNGNYTETHLFTLTLRCLGLFIKYEAPSWFK